MGSAESLLQHRGADARVTVIMPVRNGAATIGRQLDALLGQTGFDPCELVVADNGSSDDTVDVVERHPICDQWNVTVVDAAGRRGVNHARNVAVDASSGDIIVACDCDDEVSATWLVSHVAALSRGDRLVTAGPIDTTRLNAPRAVRWCGVPDRPHAVHGFDVGYGANFGFTRATWMDVGGFDERFVGGFDEYDFMLRTQKAGIDLVWLPDAVVHYRLPSTLGGTFHRAARHGRMLPVVGRAHPDVFPDVGLSHVVRSLARNLGSATRLVAREQSTERAVRQFVFFTGALTSLADPRRTMRDRPDHT